MAAFFFSSLLLLPISTYMSFNLQRRPSNGRADELQPSLGSRANNRHHLPSNIAQTNMPASTRTVGAVVVPVTNDGMALPQLPPIPGIKAGGTASSFASSTRHSQANSIAHRRTSSAGGESLPPASVENGYSEFGTQHLRPPNTCDKAQGNPGKPRFAWFRWGGSNNNANHTKESGKAGWTASEIKALATTSMRYWESDNLIDFESLGEDLGRSADETSSMLEYLLQGYVRFGAPTPGWPADSNQLITQWAAAHFPRNPAFNTVPVSAAKGGTAQQTRFGTCLSAFSCLSGQHASSAATANPLITDHVSATSGQNVLTDFREGMRLQAPTRSEKLLTKVPSVNDTLIKDDDDEEVEVEVDAASNITQPIPRSHSYLGSSRPSSTRQQPQQQPSLFTDGIRNNTSTLNTISRQSRGRRVRRRANSVAGNPRFRDSGCEPPLPIPVPDPAAELPSNSDDTHALPLEAQFLDLPPETRAQVRMFVKQFIEDNPVNFRKRVKELKAGRKDTSLCMTVDHYADFEYGNDKFFEALEAVYTDHRGSVKYTGNMFFHAQLLITMHNRNTMVNDEAVWLRVNEYATSLLNKSVKDGRYIDTTNDEQVSHGRRVRQQPSSKDNGDDSDQTSQESRNESMEVLAHRFVNFITETHADLITQRVCEQGYRPLAVKLVVDESRLKPFDKEIRRMLDSFILEDIPTASQYSKNTTILRSLEMINADLAVRCGFFGPNLSLLMNFNINEDGPADSDRDIGLSGMPSRPSSWMLGKALARREYKGLRMQFLEAMLYDHPFQPISREDLQMLLRHEPGTFGKSVEYELNTKLYAYLRDLGIQPSAQAWLTASASATLSMLRRTYGAIKVKRFFNHIDMDAYGASFGKNADLSRFANADMEPDPIPLVMTNGIDSVAPAAAATASAPASHADIGLVLKKFDEMQTLIRRIQAQNNDTLDLQQ